MFSAFCHIQISVKLPRKTKNAFFATFCAENDDKSRSYTVFTRTTCKDWLMCLIRHDCVCLSFRLSSCSSSVALSVAVVKHTHSRTHTHTHTHTDELGSGQLGFRSTEHNDEDDDEDAGARPRSTQVAAMSSLQLSCAAARF